MIITKTPFRISFCGGGSDLPSFYEKYGGCVLNTTINRYMYISIHPYFDPNKTSLKYSKSELVDDISKIEHKIIRNVLTIKKVSGVEITSTADIPQGTGLGSSSSFTVGLLHTISCYQGKYISKAQLAEMACEVEINNLKSPIGKQDQYAASFGGLNFFYFRKDGTVSRSPIIMERETVCELQNNLALFYIGHARSANEILDEQNKNMEDPQKIRALIEMCILAENMKESLESNDLSSFGKILNESWNLKKSLASGISNPTIDQIYEIALQNGALGGKLLGAGGGGFILFYCEKEKQNRLREALGFKQMDFRFEYEGSSVIYVGDKYW